MYTSTRSTYKQASTYKHIFFRRGGPFPWYKLSRCIQLKYWSEILTELSRYQSNCDWSSKPLIPFLVTHYSCRLLIINNSNFLTCLLIVKFCADWISFEFYPFKFWALCHIHEFSGCDYYHEFFLKFWLAVFLVTSRVFSEVSSWLCFLSPHEFFSEVLSWLCFWSLPRVFSEIDTKVLKLLQYSKNFRLRRACL